MSDPRKVPDVRACCGCLALRCKLYDIREKRLQQVFSDLTGLPSDNPRLVFVAVSQVSRGLLCSTCLHLLNKFKSFRMRCRNAGDILNHMLLQNENDLSFIDSTNLGVPLSRSGLYHVDCKSTKELSLSDIIHINLPDECTMDFENDDKPEDSLNNLSDSEIFHNTHDDIDNIRFSDVKMKTGIDDTNDTNKFSNEIECSDIYEISDDTDDDVIETNKDDADDNVVESIIDDDDDIILETIMDNTDNSQKKPVPVKSKTYKRIKHTGIKSELTRCFIDIRQAISKVNGDYYEMFERLYKFSLIKERPNLSGGVFQNKSNKMQREEHNFMKFLDLYKEIADKYKVDVELISIMEERRAMVEKRKSLAHQYDCVKCCKLYNSSGTLDRHVKRSHNEDLPFRCEICLYTFKREPFWVMHLFKFHCSRKKCRKCDKTIVSINLSDQWSEVNSHMSKFHSSNVTPCQFCKRTFNGKKAYCHHLRQAHIGEMNAAQCWFCGDSFVGPIGLHQHVRKIHTDAVKCVTCGVVFQNKEAMAAHITETGKCPEDKSACPMCGATFPTESLMKEHYDDTHAKYKCGMCARSFIEYEYYRVHLYKICSVNERLPKERKETTIVKRKRDKKYVAKAKKKMKDRELSFVCHVCGKGFSAPCFLNYHMRLHTGEKPYKCDQCGKAFRLVQSLLIHKTSHTGVRRFKCQICSKAFRQIGHLQSHMVTHTKEKKFACDLCEKRYTHKPSLKEHIQSVHMGMPPRRRKPKTKLEHIV